MSESLKKIMQAASSYRRKQSVFPVNSNHPLSLEEELKKPSLEEQQELNKVLKEMLKPKEKPKKQKEKII